MLQLPVPLRLFLPLLLPISVQCILNECSRFQACGVIERTYPTLSTLSPESENDLIEIEAKIREEGEEEEGSGHFEDGSGSGSGWGSGDGSSEDLADQTQVKNTGNRNSFVYTIIEAPVYDEFVPLSALDDDLPIYDTDSDPVLTAGHQLCNCAQNDTCPLDANALLNDDQSMRLDPYIELTFCRPVSDLFKVVCRGRRARVRVIGRLDPERPERMAVFEDTKVFCHCPAGGAFRRDPMTEPWLGGSLHAFKYQCA